MIEIKQKPSDREMRWFGLVPLGFFGLIGGLILMQVETLTVPTIFWSIGLCLCVLYYALRPFRLLLYRCWMKAVFPIGWTISHLLLAIVYYLMITPIGLIMRLCGRDSMQRKFEPEAQTYWIERRSHGDVARYVRQF